MCRHGRKPFESKNLAFAPEGAVGPLEDFQPGGAFALENARNRTVHTDLLGDPVRGRPGGGSGALPNRLFYLLRVERRGF